MKEEERHLAGDCGREIIVMIFLFKQGVVKIEVFDEVF